jgi:hypothetical protein
MISGCYVKPAFKIFYFMLVQRLDQFFENLHYSIFGIIAIFQVFKADTIHQRLVPGKQFAQVRQLPG